MRPGNDGKPLFSPIMPAAFWAAFRPVSRSWRASPSSRPRRSSYRASTVDRHGARPRSSTKGRHDPCVGIRAVPVGEAMVACVIADHYLRHRGQVGEAPAWPFPLP